MDIEAWSLSRCISLGHLMGDPTEPKFGNARRMRMGYVACLDVVRMGVSMAGESAREVARRAREKAGRLQRRADLFDKGAAGEDATAQILSTLPPSWTALHDVKWPGRRFANIDHIVVGPAGVFVVDSKNWSGRVTVNDGRLSPERPIA